MYPLLRSRRLLGALGLAALCVLFAGAGAAWAGEDPAPAGPPAGAPPPPPPSLASLLSPDAADEGDEDAGEADGGGADDDGGQAAASTAEGGLTTAGADEGARILGDVNKGLTIGTRRLRKAWRGTFRMNYRLRADGDESDHDLYQYLLLDLGDEGSPGLSASFHGRLTEDLDGRGDEDEFFVFDSITDTYSSRVNGRLFHAYVDYRTRGGLLRQVRLGRHYVEGGELFHVDGASVEFCSGCGPRAIQLTLFGGVPAHLFESSPSGDVIAGFRLKGRPWARAEAELDYAYIEDDTSYYGHEEAHLLSASLRQQLGRTGGFWFQYQHLNGDPRQIYFNINASDPRRDIFVRGAFHSLLTAQNDLVTDLDPYFAVAQQLEPYWDGTVAVSKGFGDRFFVEGGVSTRQLYDDDDEGRFNHNFTRWFASISTDDWPRRDVYLTLTGEHWQSDDRFTTVGFEAEWRPSRCFRIQAGTDYQRYRFDLYTADERQSSRGYYVRVRWRPRDRWQIRVRLRVEDDAFDTYTTLFTGFDVDF